MAEDRLYGKTMCAELVSGLLVIAHTTDPPERSEWTRYCELASQLYTARGSLRVLVFAEGIADGPNSTQRTEFSQKVPPEQTRVAVMTSSLPARAAITALSWFLPNIRAFRDGAVHEALAYLDTPSPIPEPAIEAALDRMRRHMSTSPSGRATRG